MQDDRIRGKSQRSQGHTFAKESERKVHFGQFNLTVHVLI